MRIQAFITHKKSEDFEACEDRFAINFEDKSIAVSDGMGSSWMQQIWAQILVNKYTDTIDWVPNRESIKELSPIWRHQVEDFIQYQKDQNVPQSTIIRNENNLALGLSAGATFVGIRFTDFRWDGDVLGDSCLIEWDGKDAVFHSSQEVDKFDNYPDYFDSDALREGKGNPKPISGDMSKDSILLLVSDPFSDFLWEHRKQRDIDEYIKQLLTISSHEDFEKLVEDWRQHGMHNDDTTLVIIEHDDDTSLNEGHIDSLSEMIKAEKIKQEKEEEKEKESNSPVDKSSPLEVERVKEFAPSENVFEYNTPPLAKKCTEVKCDRQHAVGVSKSNTVKEEKDLSDVTELFVDDFFSNLHDEIKKGNKGLISLRIVKPKIFSQDEKKLIKNALNRTLKKYDIRIKI